MANDDQDCKGSWSSWFAPGDTRQASNQDADIKHSAPVVSTSQVQDTPKPESNPLISFKHFVDDAFFAVTNLNKNLRDLGQAAQDRQAAHQEIRDQAYKRWTGAENTEQLMEIEGLCFPVTREDFDAMKLPSLEAMAKAKMLIRESHRVNRHVNPALISALFEDSDFNPHHTTSRWLSIDWFKHSPYSPVNLEANSAMAKYETKWRHAFEDLLEAALDKPMTSRERFGFRSEALSGPVSTWRGPGLDWMLSLQCRGILPPQLPSMYSNGRVMSDVLVSEGLSAKTIGRWYQEHSSHPSPDLPLRWALDNEYHQLAREIDTPVPEDATMQRPVPENECPDALGHAVGEAMRSSHEPTTELDVYEQMCNVGARCPDELGRAVGDAARQEAARAFADEENGLIDGDAGVVADHTSVEPTRANHALQDYKMQLKLLDEQSERRYAAIREAELAPVEQALSERKQLQQELDATAQHKNSSTGSEDCPALKGWPSSRTDPLREAERLIERCETLHRDQDSVNVNHEFYIDQLAEQLQVLREEHGEMAGEFAVALARLEHKVHLLEQKDRESSLAHLQDPQNVAPAQADTNRPQVLFTLTTTETTRLPDGSVKTTVVLKRKFAGGLEETQESTQTSFEGHSAPASGGKESSTKGWFWS